MNPTEEHKVFRIEQADLREILVKESIWANLGRHLLEVVEEKNKRPILYALLNRIGIYFQKSTATVIYDKQAVSGSPVEIVFKSLNSRQTGNFPKFGDPELAKRFDEYLEVGNPAWRSNDFSLYGTSYRIAFFFICYDSSGDIGKTTFEQIPRDGHYGNAIKNFLEDTDEATPQGYTKYKCFNIRDDIDISNNKKGIKSQDKLQAVFRENLARFNNVPSGSPFPVDDKDVAELLKPVREEVIDKILKRIDPTPAYSTKADFSDFFVFFRTETATRMDGTFPYTIRLLLGNEQKAKILQHYQNIKLKRSVCSWFDEATKQCRIGQTNQAAIDSGKQFGRCLLEDPQYPPEQIIDDAQQPLRPYERSAIDTAFMSGFAGFANVYPDYSRDRAEDSDQLNAADTCNGHDQDWIVTRRQAATWCLTHQVIQYDPEGQPKAFFYPIHVSGASSMAILFVFSDKSEADKEAIKRRWLMIYSFYFSAIANFVNREVRAKLKEIYLKQLTGLVGSFFLKLSKERPSLKVKRSDLDELNEACQELSAIYPFPVINFPFPNQEKNIYCFREFGIYISKDIQTYRFSRLFDFKYVDFDREIVAAVNSGMEEAAHDYRELAKGNKL